MLELFKEQKELAIIRQVASEEELKDLSSSYRIKVLNYSLLSFTIPAIALFLNFSHLGSQAYWIHDLVVSATLLFFSLYLLMRRMAELSVCRKITKEAESIERDYCRLTISTNITKHQKLLDRIHSALKGDLCSFVREKYEKYLDDLTVQLEKLEHEKQLSTLKIHSDKLKAKNKQKIGNKLQQHPLVVVKNQLQTGLAGLESRRKDLQKQWDLAYQDFSWWQKLTTASPDFGEMDSRIRELKSLKETFQSKHEKDLELVEQQYAELLSLSNQRINGVYETARKLIQENRGTCPASNELLRKASWFSTFTLSASLWDDFNRAGNIYDSLRNVNHNFQGMSDMEIWWETLWMPSDSLRGLASLTKGAYFENLVASDTGGELFDHFNHPGTDIIIDGVVTQLKATDSVSYIESVESSIPLIATSEVAAKTDAMDSGFSNAQLTDSVDLALGGTVIDFSDTTADTIFAGLGGLGFFASLRGIARAARRYNNGGDGVEAIFEGAGIAIVGTAKGLVDASEMAFNVVTSRPCRFVGRSILSGLEKLDRKLFSEPPQNQKLLPRKF